MEVAFKPTKESFQPRELVVVKMTIKTSANSLTKTRRHPPSHQGDSEDSDSDSLSRNLYPTRQREDHRSRPRHREECADDKHTPANRHRSESQPSHIGLDDRPKKVT